MSLLASLRGRLSGLRAVTQAVEAAEFGPVTFDTKIRFRRLKELSLEISGGMGERDASSPTALAMSSLFVELGASRSERVDIRKVTQMTNAAGNWPTGPLDSFDQWAWHDAYYGRPAPKQEEASKLIADLGTIRIERHLWNDRLIWINETRPWDFARLRKLAIVSAIEVDAKVEELNVDRDALQHLLQYWIWSISPRSALQISLALHKTRLEAEDGWYASPCYRSDVGAGWFAVRKDSADAGAIRELIERKASPRRAVDVSTMLREEFSRVLYHERIIHTEESRIAA